VLALFFLSGWGAVSVAQPLTDAPATVEELSRTVVGLRVDISPGARTAPVLGTHREGNGVVIGEDGLILTIGYLVLEAEKVAVVTHDGREVPAAVIAYDANSGLGLLRAQPQLALRPMPLGDSASLAEQDPVLVVTQGGVENMLAALVISRRTFAGYWEYMLDEAIFTTPPHPNFAGAALIDRDFRLVGIGSLFLQDTSNRELSIPGNMFVPINHLKPVMAALLKTGRPDERPRPWLGVNLAEQFGRVIVTRITQDGPASQAGLHVGDIILEVSGKKVESMEHFYRSLWGLGTAGIKVQLKLVQGNSVTLLSVTTRDRYRHYNQASRP
jgi:S1-C subfamily serine protease